MHDMLWGIRFNQKRSNLAQMDPKTPILFLSGALDPVGSNGAGVKKAYQSFLDAGCQDVTLKLYPEGRHEMLNERNRSQVFDDLLDWLRSKSQH
jgi:alpha-beta hydrolase superfamily lysophospholipase